MTSMEEKATKVLQLSVELERELMLFLHELREKTTGTPEGPEVLERCIRASVSRGSYDGMLKRLFHGAAKAGHLRAEYISGVIEGLQDKRDEAGNIARGFVLAERAHGVVN